VKKNEKRSTRSKENMGRGRGILKEERMSGGKLESELLKKQ
jgi:hypothetical protein